jgi:hypothetical protein
MPVMTLKGFQMPFQSIKPGWLSRVSVFSALSKAPASSAIETLLLILNFLPQKGSQRSAHAEMSSG